jgi:hypothetical protein
VSTVVLNTPQDTSSADTAVSNVQGAAEKELSLLDAAASTALGATETAVDNLCEQLRPKAQEALTEGVEKLEDSRAEVSKSIEL